MNNFYYEKPITPEPFASKVFDRNILESIKVVKLKDRLDITLPVGLGDSDEPFTFSCVELDSDYMEFRDGGRALKELSKRIDIKTMEPRIKEYCKQVGRLNLKGVREITYKVYPQGKYVLMWYFYEFIYFCSTIANFDLYPISYNMAEYGREDIDG